MARVVFFLIGLLLSLTAILKLWMLMTDPFADIRALMPAQLLWVGVILEFGIAGILFFSGHTILKLWLSAFFFALFTFFSVARLSLGFATCGCAGGLSLPTWASLAVNVSALLVLAVIRFHPRIFATLGPWPELDYRSISLKFGLFLAGTILCTWLTSGGPVNVLAANTPILNIPARSASIFIMDVENISGADVKFIGVNSSCTCITSQLPKAALRPNGIISIRIKLKPKEVGPIHQRLVFYLDHPIQRRFFVNLTGTAF